MIEINLVPDVKQELLRAQSQRNLLISVSIIAAIAAGVVVVLVAGYVYGAQSWMMKNSNDTINKEFNKLSAVEDLDKILTIRNQLSAVSTLNKDKHMTSRVYDMLNVVVPKSPHNIRISSIAVTPPVIDKTQPEESQTPQGSLVAIEGQTTGSYASLEVFEKTIAAAVMEYESEGGSGELNCGNADEKKLCRYLVVGGGDRATSVQVAETSYGEDQNGAKTLYFKLSFTVVPEFFSSTVSNVSLKIGKDGNVTDSFTGVPRAIFEARTETEGGTQ